MSELIDRQKAIDAILHITNCKSVRELFEYNQEHHLTEMWSGGVNDAIDAVIGVESATDNNVGTKLGTNLAEVGTDCISRQSAIEVIERARAHIGHNMERAVGRVFLEMLDDVGLSISKLPTIQPKRGKWIENKGQQTLMQNFIERGEVWRVCSVCGAGHMIGHKYAIDKAYHDRYHNFCPNCGARMEVTE